MAQQVPDIREHPTSLPLWYEGNPSLRKTLHIHGQESHHPKIHHTKHWSERRMLLALSVDIIHNAMSQFSDIILDRQAIVLCYFSQIISCFHLYDMWKKSILRTCTHTHTHTHTRTHTRTHARTRTHTHTPRHHKQAVTSTVNIKWTIL